MAFENDYSWLIWMNLILTSRCDVTEFSYFHVRELGYFCNPAVHGGRSMKIWFVVWNMTFMTFHVLGMS